MAEYVLVQEGTKVVATDLATGDSDERIIRNDYCLIVDGDLYLDGIASHANGTVILTIKRAK
jgi:hypothetical protein